MDIKELQQYKLIMLKDVTDICERNGITYYLYGGTLLGAVRHKGYIPWDDDIDLAMLWDDYCCFLKIAQKELGDKYFVQNYLTDKKYFNLFTQIRMNNTTSMPVQIKKLDIHWGMCIDLFPLFSMEEDDRKYTRQLKAFQFARSLLAKDIMLAKNEKPRGAQKLINCIPEKLRLRTVSSILNKYSHIDMDKEWLGCLDSLELKRKYRLADFKEKALYDFEGMKLWGPGNGRAVLVCSYGEDYMTPPPLEQRGGHDLPLGEIINDIKHDYKEYR